jgi:hypothetical protein
MSSDRELSTTGVGRQFPGHIELLAGLVAIVTALRDLRETFVTSTSLDVRGRTYRAQLD